MSDLPVLSVASEVFPLVKTGGLADVAGALPGALAAEGVAMRTLLPGYPAVMAALRNVEPAHHWADLLGVPARLLAASHQGLPLLVLDAPAFYDRAGGPYAGPDGHDHPDNAQRFAALSLAAAEIGRGAVRAFQPRVIHAHDWQAGLTAAYLRGAGGGPGTVMTVHNLAFQGIVPASMLEALRLPPALFSMEGFEYHGAIGMLKAGLQFSDRITTVSPTYAVEVRGREAGFGLDGVLRARAGVFSGILNGIDTGVWNPAADAALPAPFSAGKPTARRVSRQALRAKLGLAADADGPLFGVISRLTEQKGLDLLLAALPTLLATGGQLALLGAGDRAMEAGYVAAAARHPGRIAAVIGYDEALAHLIQAGSDAILVPSRFEPCGLTQLCALRYGAVPVVARVGGLADSVIDSNPMAMAANGGAGVGTGIHFAGNSLEALEAALLRTAELFRQPALWRGLQKRGMATDVSWAAPARRYAALYRAIAAP